MKIFDILDKKTERKKMHIDQLKTRTVTGYPVIRIAHWKHDENEDNRVDSNILFSKVIAGMIY